MIMYMCTLKGTRLSFLYCLNFLGFDSASSASSVAQLVENHLPSGSGFESHPRQLFSENHWLYIRDMLFCGYICTCGY